jgi:peptidoglycan/LPS O-acetylase OafA/YrhL
MVKLAFPQNERIFLYGNATAIMKGLQKDQLISGRLQSIDALRGLAALGVVAYHIVGAHPKDGIGGAFSWALMPFMNAFSFGYVSVFLFFVISGFCIHLQWARSKAIGVEPQINFGAFWKRRLRRLYPPYLIAMALYLGIAAATSHVMFTPFYTWDVISHVLMLHNLDTRTVYSINGVFWTLAIEEQLYLAYFILLFLRKRWGWTLTLSASLAARVGWYFLTEWLKNTYKIETPLTEAAMAHWFTWALGAVAVEAAFGLVRMPVWLTRIWAGLAALAGAVGIAYLLDHGKTGSWHDLIWMFMHPAWGLGFFIIVNWAVSSEREWCERVPFWVASLSKIGLFSYSLYLIHELVLMETWQFYFLGMSDTITAVLVTAPLSVVAAWLFFVVCERPFLVKRCETAHQMAPAEDDSLLSEPIATTSKQAQASI